MVLEELERLLIWSERHRRLLARILIAFSLSVIVDLVCAVLIWSDQPLHASAAAIVAG
jgi:hypothetical protein